MRAEPSAHGTSPAQSHWALQDIPFDRIDASRLRGREELLVLLAGSSFIEFASDTYAGNLAGYCDGDPEIVQWLVQRWEKEEVLHGLALRTYVERVWPEFPWQAAYDAFFAEYERTCGAVSYAPTPGLEMAARCVVETGTATCYQAIRDLTEEPVLRQLAEHIRSDEVRHYKHFLRYFTKYGQRERHSPLRILRALIRRLSEARHSDVQIAMWHAYAHLHPMERRDGRRFAQMRRRLMQALGRHYPAEQGIRMLLKPLRLSRLDAMLPQFVLAPLGLVLRTALLR